MIGGPIPFEDSEEAAFGASALRNALKAALPELESELEARERSGDAETIDRLRSVIAPVSFRARQPAFGASGGPFVL